MTAPIVDLSDGRSFKHGFPHEFFTWLRREEPVYWHEPTERTPGGEGFWVVSRHAETLQIARDDATYSSDRGGDRPFGGTGIEDVRGSGHILNMMDDPRHRRVRGLVNQGFTPHNIGKLEGELRERTRRILDDIPDAEPFDFVTRVARELPLQAICIVLGVPQEDRGKLGDWIDQGVERAGTATLAVEFSRKVASYGAELSARKRLEPADDSLSVIVHARLDDGSPPLDDEELASFFLLLFAAGADTTRSAIAGGLKALVENPEQLETLRTRPGVMKTAIEEIVRWTTPSCYKRRTATRDVELCGRKIRAGDKVTYWEMSANRDESVFEKPFEFDIRRSPNPHMGFGNGVHFCLGANLARLEMRVMFEELLARYTAFEFAGPVEWVENNRLFGLKRLPICASEGRSG
jgi:cytochrome P450